MSEVKIQDSQDHQDRFELEKIAENCYKEVLDSVALTLYGHWIGNGMKKYDLEQSQRKGRGRTSSNTRARGELLKPEI